MRIDYFRNFIELAHCNSFSEAARRLHISQPVLSKHISLLEKEFQADLFARTKPHVELTEQGKTLLEESYLIMEHFQRAKAMLSKAERSSSPVVAFGGLNRNADVVELISRVRYQIHEQQLDLVLKRKEYQNLPFVEQLEEDHVDLFFSMLNLEDYPLGPTMEAHLLFHNSVVALIQKNHRLAGRECLYLDDFSSETIIVPLGSYALTGRQIIEPRLGALVPPPSIRPIYFEGINDFANIVIEDDILFIEAPLYETFRFPENIVAVPVAPEALVFPIYLIHKAQSSHKMLPVFIDLTLKEAHAMMAERSSQP
ncbi:MAG: LysR family transcriptional regulator [Eggerthellaceae bacterium]|jgi:DNA-binding transcriptional LysR family regulator|nr:LysR family transcriptional regulator [Eggerthellaceae bacterium]MDR2715555.1 LysR family transcriptional regulator [Coriobacteriaceae bacterium]